MKLSTMTFGNKLGAAFGLILLLVTSIAMVSHVAMNKQMEVVRNTSPENLTASKAALEDMTGSAQRNVAILSILVFAATVAVAWPIIRQVKQRVVRLKADADTLGRGDFSAGISVDGADEFSRLSASLNDMRIHLGG